MLYIFRTSVLERHFYYELVAQHLYLLFTTTCTACSFMAHTRNAESLHLPTEFILNISPLLQMFGHNILHFNNHFKIVLILYLFINGG